MAINLEAATNSARYSDVLNRVLDDLNAVEILRLSYEADYSGHVDVDALLADGRVFSYEYFYGSCSGCDEWEARNLSDAEIEKEMLKDATIFDSREQYDEALSRRP